MSYRNHVGYAVVASGGQVSDDFAVAGLRDIAIQAPLINSCQIFLRGNFQPVNPASADFVRLRNPDFVVGSQWAWPVGPGSEAVVVSPVLAPFPWGRIETAVAQTDTRTFTILGKP